MKFIEVISVPVSDQQAAKEFYLKIGFEIMIEAPMGEEGMWIQLGLPGTNYLYHPCKLVHGNGSWKHAWLSVAFKRC